MGRILFPLGGVALVLAFLLYAKTRMPVDEPRPGNDAPRNAVAEESAAGSANANLPRYKSARSTKEKHDSVDGSWSRAENGGSPQPSVKSPSAPGGVRPIADAPETATGRTDRDDDRGDDDPRRAVSEDPRGASQRDANAVKFKGWLARQRKLLADMDDLRARVSAGEAALAQDFNDASDAMAKELIELFGSETASQYAKRIPLYRMDVETGELIRVDETGRRVD